MFMFRLEVIMYVRLCQVRLFLFVCLFSFTDSYFPRFRVTGYVILCQEGSFPQRGKQLSAVVIVLQRREKVNQFFTPREGIIIMYFLVPRENNSCGKFSQIRLNQVKLRLCQVQIRLVQVYVSNYYIGQFRLCHIFWFYVRSDCSCLFVCLFSFTDNYFLWSRITG